jgi:hypothetical protein
MNAQLLTQVADAAKRDGLTLTWSLIRLAEKLERDQESLLEAQGHDAQGDGAAVEAVRLDNEALALVLMVAIKSVPASGL